jgi:hypothetical protein
LLVLSLVAQLAGWAVFGVAIYRFANLVPSAPRLDSAAIVALATGSALYTLAVIALLTLPVALIARGLALFLRIARHEHDDDDDEGYDYDYDRRVRPAKPVDLRPRRLPQALIVDDGAVPEAQIVDENPAAGTSRPRRRAVHASIQPFSSAEMRFFQEGDQLAEPGADS